MAGTRDLEQRLADLAALGDAPEGPEAIALLRGALARGPGILAARAARRVGEAGLLDLVPDLVATFVRLGTSGPKRDPGCLGKAAVAEALQRIGRDVEGTDLREDVFRPGASLTQLEPVFGGRRDTAGPVRIACVRGLVHWTDPHVLEVLADLLADEDPQVREEAARTLAWREGEDGLPLLGLRVAVGESEPAVLQACLDAGLELGGVRFLPRVEALLTEGDEWRFECAALALGAFRDPASFRALAGAWPATLDAGRRDVLVRALAALRLDDALGFLLELLEDADEAVARQVVDALTPRRGEAALRSRVEEALRVRDDADLLARWG